MIRLHPQQPEWEVKQSGLLVSLPGEHFDPAFSPDGSHLAFTWISKPGGTRNLYVQAAGQETTIRLT
jgi:Tol biopolymer transport system component